MTDKGLRGNVAHSCISPRLGRPGQQLGKVKPLGFRVTFEFNQSCQRSFWELGSHRQGPLLLLVAERTQPRIGQSWSTGRSVVYFAE